MGQKMKLKQLLVLASALLVAAPAVSQVYKCTAGGKIVYSDQPCQNAAGSTLDIKARYESPLEQEDRGRREAFFAANPDIDERTKEAVKAGRLFVGMSAEAATASWGTFRKVNRSHYADGEHIQWVYHHLAAPGAQKYVYVRNGVVTAIQE